MSYWGQCLIGVMSYWGQSKFNLIRLGCAELKRKVPPAKVQVRFAGFFPEGQPERLLNGPWNDEVQPGSRPDATLMSIFDFVLNPFSCFSVTGALNPSRK